jgi:NAD(P)-dependent dehydrogenase (short-subunit alcohol dehydrogenase family)
MTKLDDVRSVGDVERRLSPASVVLDGRVAVVTGGAKGIGAATAIALARFGADVAICDRDASGMRDTAAVIEAAGRRCLMGELDVRDAEAVRTWLSDVGSQWPEIHVLVNNAGGGFYAPFADITSKGQQALVDENFTSVTHFVRGCLPLMSAGGSIVNVTSIEASRAAPGFSIYAAMKSAVENLTKTLALELATRQIRVNAVAPDAIPTPGDESLAAALHQDSDSSYELKVPLGWGRAEDCAAAIVYLASDLSTWITGTIIAVDGGSLAGSGWVRRPDGTYGH